ncbi:unnamed protein product [Polarella glacialis]|uniref:ADP-ribosylation factor n=1 Tax=Polarella glacialis TaxID=89957 RepID=A0A813JLL3_POLGL|nr:unnamed protein product [Polarella glacialis]
MFSCCLLRSVILITCFGHTKVGLDGAGKTCILYRLRLGAVVTTIPTAGFNVETLRHDDANLVCWDAGCNQALLRGLYTKYFETTAGVVFVVDSSASDRFSESRLLLETIIRNYGTQIGDAPFLVLANKQDLPTAVPVSDLIAELDLHKVLEGRRWLVEECSAFTGHGLHESLQVLVRMMRGEKTEVVRNPCAIALTLDVTQDEVDGIAVSCTNMAGDTVFTVAVADPRSYTVGHLRSALELQLGKRRDQVTLLSGSGRLFLASDDGQLFETMLCKGDEPEEERRYEGMFGRVRCLRSLARSA